MDWYFLVWKRYAQFEGRSRRTEYWMFTLFHSIILVALIILQLMYKNSTLGLTFGLVYAAYVFATLVPSIAVSVRRLHDTGRSGWYFLLGMIPLVGLILLVFMCEDGTRGPNEYGGNPKEPEKVDYAYYPRGAE